MDVGTLRELLRNLEAWRALFETDGIDTLTAPDGTSWSLWDLEYLYSQIHRLSPRQRESIQLCLVENVKEVDAAKIMGVSETNPVAMYATLGIRRILAMIENGELPRFRETSNAEVA